MSKNPLKSRGLGRGSKVGNNISSQARYDHFDITPYLTVLVVAKSLDKPLDKISVCKTDAQKPLYQAVFEGSFKNKQEYFESAPL